MVSNLISLLSLPAAYLISIHGPHVRMHVAYLAKQLVAASRVLRLLSLTELYYSPSFSMINLHVSLHVK